jgi:hypothetical protein
MAWPHHARHAAPVTLAEQMLGWVMWRAGDSVEHIAMRLRRRPMAVRLMLFGER